MKKKIYKIATILTLALALCACSKEEKADNDTTEIASTEEPTIKYSLGDTVSTDIMEFTLDNAEFSFYASSVNDETYATPVEKTSGIFQTNKGHTFVCMKFQIKNTDRGGINIGDVGENHFNPYIVYKGEKHDIKGFDLNFEDGVAFTFRWSLCGSSYNNMKKFESSNILMDSEEKLAIQTLGQINTEPNALTDGFEFVIELENSAGEIETFTYVID